jgi:adenylate kinase
MDLVKNFSDFLIERELPDSQGKILVVMGPPGSGKGTFSEKLADRQGFHHISTGELLRKSKNPEIKKKVERGDFIDDQTVVKMIRRELKKIDPDDGIIIDGFPRTVKQASLLDSLLGKMGLGLSHTIYLDIDEETAKGRITARAEREDRKDDKDPEVVAKRFRDYEEKTAPLIDLYTKNRKLKKYNAAKGSESVYKKIVKALELNRTPDSE